MTHYHLRTATGRSWGYYPTLTGTKRVLTAYARKFSRVTFSANKFRFIAAEGSGAVVSCKLGCRKKDYPRGVAPARSGK